MNTLHQKIFLFIILLSTFLIKCNTIPFQEIFAPENIYADSKKINDLNRACEEFGLALKFKQSENNTRIAMIETQTKRGIIPQALLEIPQNILEGIYNKFVRSNAYTKRSAEVEAITPYSELNLKEKQAVKKRDAKSWQAIEAIAKRPSSASSLAKTTNRSSKKVTVGIASSGGGFRASYFLLGALQGLSECEVEIQAPYQAAKIFSLLDTISYISCTSGSCWPTFTWLMEGRPINIFRDEFIDRTTRGFFGGLSNGSITKLISSVSEYLLRKIIFRETPSIIDLYGYILGQLMFDEHNKENPMKVFLHSLTTHLQIGNFPIPIFNAIIPHDYENRYMSLEMTPYTVGHMRSQLKNFDNTIGGRIESGFYGRRCHNLKTKNMSPPIPIISFYGIVGSVISINTDELFQEIKNRILSMLGAKTYFSWPTTPENKTATDQSKANRLARYSCELLFDIIENTKPVPFTVATARPFATYVNNFMFGTPGFRYHHQERDAVVDAGIWKNLPLAPLLDRKVDLIIAIDVSNTHQAHGKALRQEELFAKKHGLPFPKINYKDIEKRTYTIFDDGPQSNAPVIVYVPIVKNKNYDPNYDPRELMGFNKKLNTFNLSYEKEDAEKLTGLSRQAIKELESDLRNKITELVARG